MSEAFSNPDQPIKVRHHYVPVCYLRMFTPSEARDGALHCLDLDTGKSWLSSPESVAYENDYNSVEGDLRPDAYEDAFAKVEQGAAPHWHKMIKEKKFPEDPHEVNWVLNFLALQEARTKPNRKAIYDMQVAAYTKVTELITATPERFASVVARAKNDGVEIPELPEGITLEDIRKKILSGSLKLSADIHNNYYLERTLEHVDLMLRLFHEREWKVIDLSGTGIDLITSDDPVSVVWTREMPPLHPPGFGMGSTLVLVPLSRSQLLVGGWEEQELNLPATTDLALKVNNITLRHAFRFVFSTTRVFSFAHESGSSDEEAVCQIIESRAQESERSTERQFVHSFGPVLVLTDHKEPNFLDVAAL